MPLQTFDLEKQKRDELETDWKFGALSPASIVTIPQEERDQYFPQGEVQFSTRGDFLDCATRNGPVEQLEALLTYHYLHNMLPQNKEWLREKGYIIDGKVALSDRFIAILSGTTKQGNSLKAPYDAVYRHGVIPKPMLPKEDWMTWEDYHNPESITQEMRDLGQEFKRRFTVNYEEVHRVLFDELLKEEMVGVAGHGWEKPVDGVYRRTAKGYNHAFLLYKLPKYQARDSYYDFTNEGVQIPGDFTKTLAPDYDLYEKGYRLFISAEATAEQLAIQVSVFNELIKSGLGRFFVRFLELFMTRRVPLVDPLPPAPVAPPVTPPVAPTAPEPVKPAEETTREKIYQEALLWLGKDASPNDKANDELGCAESVSTIVRRVVPSFPIMLGTADMLAYLKKNKQWKATLEPKPGNIIVSATGTGNGSIRGHCGIHAGGGKIMSNRSATGKWEQNFTVESWVKRYRTGGGMAVYYFEVVHTPSVH